MTIEHSLTNSNWMLMILIYHQYLTNCHHVENTAIIKIIIIRYPSIIITNKYETITI